MRSLKFHDVAKLSLPAEDREAVLREFNRPGNVVVLKIEDSVLRTISRYSSSYFHMLRKQGRLKIQEDQLVIGI